MYYLILVLYSHRFRSTFAVFWLIAGGVHLLAGCAPFPYFVYIVIYCFCIIFWILFLFIEFKILRTMFSPCRIPTDWMIILGAQVRGKRVTDSLKRRLDAAVIYLNQFPGTCAVVSGGQGEGEEITEADAMAEYLIRHGIDNKRIFRERKSTSTKENLLFSSRYLDLKKNSVCIVSNGFHVYRASLIAQQLGYQKIFLLPAGSNPVFQLNYLVREFFAVLYVWFSEKRK